MKKLILSLVLVLSTNIVIADEETQIPNIPENCFKNKNSCLVSTIEDNQNGDSYVKVIFFAKMNGHKFSVKDVKNRFFDFEAWPQYASSSDLLNFQSSITLDLPNPEEIKRHYTHYIMDPPNWLIPKTTVKEVTQFNLQSHSQTLSSYSFKTLTNEKVDIPKVGILQKPKGVSWKYGNFHIIEDSKDLLIIFETNVRPSVTLSMDLAQKYITQSIQDIGQGMIQ